MEIGSRGEPKRSEPLGGAHMPRSGIRRPARKPSGETKTPT